MASLFTASFVIGWPQFFNEIPLQSFPSFDARVVLYPTLDIVRDYLCWRQADTHINCLYNYTLCTLVRAGMGATEATEFLRKTLSSDKNEILFKHGINYNMLPVSHRKGTLLIREKGIIERNDDLIEEKKWKQIKKVFE